MQQHYSMEAASSVCDMLLSGFQTIGVSEISNDVVASCSEISNDIVASCSSFTELTQCSSVSSATHRVVSRRV